MTDDAVLSPPDWRALLEEAAAASVPPGRAVLHAARRLELIAYLSGAFDLAEGEAMGHAARVAQVARAIAQQVDLDAATCRRIVAAALLHDSGVAVRHLPVGFDRTGGHVAAGAWVAERFGFEPAVGAVIRQTHERWDGDGRPLGLASAEIRVEALIVSAAHWVCDETVGATGPLRARAQVLDRTVERLSPIAGRQVAAATRAVLSTDALWLDFWSPLAAGAATRQLAGDGRPSVRTVIEVSHAAGAVIDAALYTPGHAERVALLAGALAHTGGLSTEEVRAVEVAGRLMDIAQLAVPPHTLDKPDILTLAEMERMRQHPVQAARLLEPMPGFRPIARWIEYHHVRPDGRGYPDLPAGIAPPLPAGILSVADAYWAMRVDRPYRLALTPAEALEVIQQAAGAQFDRTVVDWLPAALRAAISAQAEPPPTLARMPRGRHELHAVRSE